MAPKTRSKSPTPPPSNLAAITSLLQIQNENAIILTESDFVGEEQPQQEQQQNMKTSSKNKKAQMEEEISKKSTTTNSKHDDIIDFASLFLKNKAQKSVIIDDNNNQQQIPLTSEALQANAVLAAAISATTTTNKKDDGENEEEENNLLIVGRGKQKDADGDDSSDSSWEESPTLNRIGDVPLEWYKDSDHVGYDVEGRRILRPKETALDSLLSQTDDPNALRTIIDPTTGEKKILSNKDLELLFNIQRNRAPNPEFTAEMMYQDYTDNYQVEFDPLNHPLARGGAPSKKTYVPSLRDTKALAKEVIRQRREEMKQQLKEQFGDTRDEEEDDGKDEEKEEEKEDEEEQQYDLWEDADVQLDNRQRFKLRHRIPKTKVPPPGTYESYRPPPEYLPSDRARLRFKKTRKIDRKEHFLPQQYDALRHVPFYNHTMQDRYQRCLDLSVFPRRQRTRLIVDPDKLLADLPEPKDLKPFPERLCFIYKGHTATVRSISVSPNGEYLATGCDDHVVRIFEALNGRLVKRYDVGGPVMQVAFCPNPALNILAVAVEYQVLFFVPVFIACDAVNDHSIRFMRAPQILTSKSSEKQNNNSENNEDNTAENIRGRGITQTVQDADETAATEQPIRDLDDETEKQIRADFVDATPTERQAGIVVKVVLHARVRRMDFHNKGDYMALLCPKDHVKYRQTIMLQISQRKVFCPFRKFSEIVTDCKFHPTEPYFFLATTNSIRCYNLLAHRLIKRFKSPGGLTTCLSIHPEGENFIVGDSTSHTQWFDTELSEKAYRRLKSHKGVVNEVGFHPNTGAYPLFASASSDGQVHVFHGMVYDDYNKNALLVPVKILKHSRPVYCMAWHPTLPWVFTGTDDGTVCCWCE